MVKQYALRVVPKRIYSLVAGIKNTIYMGLMFRSFYNKDTGYLFIYHDIGEVVFSLSYFEEWKKYYNFKNVCVISHIKYKSVISMFTDAKKILMNSNEKISALEFYIKRNKVYRNQKRNVFFIYGFEKYEMILNNIYNNEAYKNETVYPPLITQCLGIPLSNNITRPTLKRIKKELIDDYMEKHNMKSRRFFLLIPKTRSGKEMPVFFWEEIVKSVLLMGGYDVYTNCEKSDEEAIKRTKPLRVPLEYVPIIAKYAEKVISIQCGLGDIISLFGVPIIMLRQNVTERIEKNRYNKELLNISSFVVPNGIYLNIDNKDEVVNVQNRIIKIINGIEK